MNLVPKRLREQSELGPRSAEEGFVVRRRAGIAPRRGLCVPSLCLGEAKCLFSRLGLEMEVNAT